MADAPIIDIVNLEKRYRSKNTDVFALQGINLAINKGDIFGVIGKSGAGKSTLVRCINMLETPSFIGLKNYAHMFFTDDNFPKSLRNTLVFALLTGPLSYGICLFFAWMINEMPRQLRWLITLIFYAPSISGTLYVIWGYIFSNDSYGLLNAMLIQMGITMEPIKWTVDSRYIMPILIIVQLWLSLGTSFLALIAGLQGVDKSLYEAGAIDGISSRWQELKYLTLPQMKPQLLFGAVMSITSAFSIHEVTVALAGFPSTEYAAHTMVNHMWDYGYQRFEMGYASAIAAVLFLMMLVCRKLINLLLERVGR